LGYEVLAGNTSDKTTLRGMLRKIEACLPRCERPIRTSAGQLAAINY
jgi:hypothetical protein